MTIKLNLAPAYGQQGRMVAEYEWDTVSKWSGRSLSELAQDCLEDNRPFFVVLGQLDNIKSALVEMDEFQEHAAEYLFCRSFFLFSYSQKKRVFSFEMSLRPGEETDFQLPLLRELSLYHPVEPDELVSFINSLPPSKRLLNRISRYILYVFTPLANEWRALVKAVHDYSDSIPRDQLSLSSSASLVHALYKTGSSRRVRKLRVMKSVDGVAVYVFYSLLEHWRRSQKMERKLGGFFIKGSRNPLLLYTLSLLNIERNISIAEHMHQLYCKHKHPDVVSAKSDQFLKDRIIERQLRNLLETDLSKSDRAEYSYALSLVYRRGGRIIEASKMREEARDIALKGMREEPDNPVFLETYGSILRNSPLRQERDYGAACITRARRGISD